MDVVTTSLEALIQRATNASLSQPEAAGIEAFCSVMANSPDGALIGTRVLASRIQSQNASEALLALTMLDKCMKRGDPLFYVEVGKFRFLNEMIKLVSPKYYGNRTVPAVRQKVLQLLYVWTLEYPSENKIKDAYDMLKKQGVIKETPTLPPPEVQPAPVARTKSATFEDEEKSKLLQKLLQSKNPDDLQAANRLIKTMVKEEERRSARALQEARAAREAASLLGEVLAACRSGPPAPQQRRLAADLRDACRRLRTPLLEAARATLPPEVLGEILDANDELARAFQKYDDLENSFPAETKQPADSLVKLGEDNSSSCTSSPAESPPSRKTDPAKMVTPLDDLGEIFSSIGERGDSALLTPVPLVPCLTNNTNGIGFTEKPSSSKQSSNGLAALDALGKDLLKQSLAESKLEDSLKKQDKKVPMNAMDSTLKPTGSSPSHNKDILDLDYLINRIKQSTVDQSNTSIDDVMVDLNMDDSILKAGSPDDNPPIGESNGSADAEKHESDTKNTTSRMLNDIELSLESVEPSGLTPLTVFEEEKGLTVVLHFVKDRPKEDVAVFVVSTTSRNPHPIEEYKFHTVVPKGYKSRLLLPTGSNFPSFKPFIPPAAITQLLLVAAPSSETATVNMHFLITYVNNGDAISEMGHVDDLPLRGD